MSRGYHVVPSANLELEDVLLYVAINSGPDAADRLESEFHESMQRIAMAPMMGHTRTDLADAEVRFVPVHKFLIAYLPETSPIQIVRIVHGSRDIAKQFGDWPRPGQ